VLENLTLPACVATSSSPARVARSLAISGLAGYFGDKVFTASQVANGKPAPDLFLFAAARMRAGPRRTLVIEDSAPGVLAAQAAGMTVLGYTGGSHMRGQTISGTEPLCTFDNWADFPHLLSTLSPDGATF
jgi:beta-phosphoglucomutase-like phosphatase (HAD superfamily)